MKYVLLILIFAITLPTLAAEDNSLVIYLNSGTKISFPVKEKPQITFEGSIMCINTKRYQISEVKKYTFSKNEETGIEEVEGCKNGIGFSFLDGDKIAISVKDPSVAVQVYSANGIRHAVKRETGINGNIVINMKGLMPGIYIISVGDETLKIRKR